MQSTKEAYDQQEKRVYYLSLEFLIGRLMRDAFSNLGLMDNMREALSSLGVDLDVIAALEPDAALGNGGLGRLAACFMESMATVDIPALWLRHPLRPTACSARRSTTAGRSSCPRPGSTTAIPGSSSGAKRSFEIGFGGSVEVDHRRRTAGSSAMSGSRSEQVLAVAYDTPIVGWRGKRVNTLRLWTRACRRPDPARRLQRRRPHRRARRKQQGRRAHPRALSRPIRTPAGQELRLRQEYFFSSASLQDIVRRHLQQYRRSAVAARQGRHPAQRHPSGDRGRRADAAPDRRPRLDFDEAWEHHQAAPSATPTTRCCPRRWRAGRCRCSSGCCRATCRSSTRSTPSVLLEARAADQFADEQIRRRSR